MRYLRFHGSSTKILLPSADERMTAEEALDVLAEGDELSGCVVSGLDLADQRLERVALRNCVLERANLANTTVDDVRLERVVLADSMLVGFNPGVMSLRSTLFDTCRLDVAILSGLKVVQSSAFVGCSMREVDLSRADASGCTFHSCDLSAADLRSARLAGADLRESRLDDIRGLTTVRGVVLSPDQLADLLVCVQRELQFTVDDVEAGPTVGWRDVPDR